MAHILVIGASRGIGLACCKYALDAGHSVRGFARSAADMTLPGAFQPMPGDATQAGDLAPALDGIDAVLLTLGIKAGVSMLWSPVTLFSQATQALVPLMEQHGPDRLICVTGIGAGTSLSALSLPERLTQNALLGHAYRDKTRQEEIIRGSSLRWTLLRPTILTNGRASGRVLVLRDPAKWRNGMVPRADVAQVAIDALGDNTLVGADPVVTR